MIKKMLIWTLLLTLVVGCSNLPTANGATSEPLPKTQPEPSQNTNAVSITARLNEPLTDGESLLLAKVDALTGAMIAPVFYEMKSIGPLIYEVKVSTSGQGIFRYKYIKVGDEQAAEVTSIGSVFDYRSFDLDGVSEVTDVISGWENGRYFSATGRIAGTVRSSTTDAPIAGVMVTAQGNATYTDAFGRYEFAGLPFGTFLVGYSIDGNIYENFQQQAIVESNKVTLADVWLKDSALADVTFNMTLGEPSKHDGNVFLIIDPLFSPEADQNSMIKMERSGEDGYKVSVKLPIGETIGYKYSTGDGFWGAEKNADGAYLIRSVTVTEIGAIISDRVDFISSASKKITIHTPPNSANVLPVNIQYNAFGWSDPIELASNGPDTYVTQIADPNDLIDHAQIRVCVGKEPHLNCGLFESGLLESTIDLSNNDGIEFNIASWEKELISFSDPTFESTLPGGADFEAGYSLVPNIITSGDADRYSKIPSGTNVVVTSKGSLRFDGYNFSFIEPYSAVSSLKFTEELSVIKKAGLTPWIYLSIDSIVDQHGLASDQIIAENPDRLLAAVGSQLMNLIQVANQNNVDTIVIGGDGLSKIIEGSGATEFAEGDQFNKFWVENFAQIRSHFNGTIYYGVKYNNTGLLQIPSAEYEMDGYLVDWTAGTGGVETGGFDDVVAKINSNLEYDIIPSIPLGKRIIIRANIPSDDNVLLGCANNDEVNCLLLDSNLGEINTLIQQNIYQAFITAITNRDDIEGFFSGGLDPRAIAVDDTANVYGKPAFMDMNSWLGLINEN